MIFSTITQNKLELTADTTVIPAQFSSNIELQFIQDDVNFPGYTVSASASVYDTKIIECADVLNAGGTIAVNPDGTFAVPSSVLDQPGYLAIAFTLTSGNENVVLAPVVYKINTSIKTISPLPPSTDEWQQIVEAYVNTFLTNNVPTKAEIQAVQDSVNNIINGTTAVGNANELGGVAASQYTTDTELAQAISNTLANYCPYKIGDIYQTTNKTNPSEIWPKTEWEQIEGEVLGGYKKGDPNFGTLGKSIGEAEHTLTVDEIPSHTHNTRVAWDSTSGTSAVISNLARLLYAPGNPYGLDSQATGGGQAHNNIQPTRVVMIWIRTA